MTTGFIVAGLFAFVLMLISIVVVIGFDPPTTPSNTQQPNTQQPNTTPIVTPTPVQTPIITPPVVTYPTVPTPVITPTPVVTPAVTHVIEKIPTGCTKCGTGYYQCAASSIKSTEWYNGQASLVSSYRLSIDPVNPPIMIDGIGYYFRQTGTKCT